MLSIQGGAGDGVDNWFNNHFRQEVGNGIGTLFWWDPWLDGGTLCCIFTLFIIFQNYNFLFHIDTIKN